MTTAFFIKRLYSLKSNIDPYKILNIPRNATSKEIKAAYFKLAKLHHPDSRSEQASADSFLQITKAYEMLRIGTNPGASAKQSWTGSSEWQKYQDPSFYKGEFSTGPIYMSNGKMAGLILLASAIGGTVLSAFYLQKREQLRLSIQESSISSRNEYEAVIQKSKKSSLDAEIKKLEKKL